MSNNKWKQYSNLINDCYLQILNRPADRSGINTYMRQLSRGWGKKDIIKDLLESDEAKQKNNTYNNNFTVKTELESLSESSDEEELISQLDSKIEIVDDSDSIVLTIKSHETDKLNDIEYFNYLQKDVINYWKSLEDDNINKDKYLKLLGEAITQRWKEASNINSISNKISQGLLQNIKTNLSFSVNKQLYDNFYIKNTDSPDLFIIYLNNSSEDKLYIKIDSINLTNLLINDYKGCFIGSRNISTDITKATYFEKVSIGYSNYYHLKVVSGVGIDNTLLSIPERKKDVGINKYLAIDPIYKILKLVDFSTLHNTRKQNIICVWST